MADKKISALPAAATPLAGTEVLPVVQGGVTDQVSVANLTVGRDVGVKKLNATDNVVIATAGKGIDFSANTHAAGMTSELLDWYEEGTWTPVAEGSTSAGTCTYSFQQAHYVRTGGMVQFTCALGWSGHTGTGDLKITGLPFAIPAGQDSAPCSVWAWGLTFSNQLTAYTSGSAINLIEIASGAGVTAVPVDTDVASLQISGFYFVT